ncbi:MAG: 8-amino-7-oxononanoate synthase [Phycisphaeraceae bacterium]
MPTWLDQLRHDLTSLEQSHLRRALRPLDHCDRIVNFRGRHAGKPLLNLASNDYLGLASHPHLRDAVVRAAQQQGVGSGASRLVTGHLEAHAALEARFAKFKHAEAALLFPTGFMANLAVLTSLITSGGSGGSGGLIVMDKLNHASLIDAARYSGADVRVYPHLNYRKAERLLAESDAPRKLLISDTVFSMDGDCADIHKLCELRDRYDAILIVDEAHATGVLGDNGEGLGVMRFSASGSQLPGADVAISTASKALGSLGGIVTGPQVVIDTLINRARSFIYTTAVPPTTVAAIDAALDVLRDEPHRRSRLGDLSAHVRGELNFRGWHVPMDNTPIIPLIVGSAEAALALSQQLEQAGLLVPAIRPPTVPPNTARLRLSLRCDLTDDDVQHLLDALSEPPCPHGGQPRPR